MVLDKKNMQKDNGGRTFEDKLLSLQTSNFLDRMVFNFIQEISIIGFRYCFDKNRSKMRRLMWSMLILLAIGLAGYQICDRIALYTSYSTTSDINMINANTLDFPQVTICNENAARMSVAKKYGMFHRGSFWVTADYNFTVTRAGSFYGLTLALFANQLDYLGTTSPSAGFRLLLHDPAEFPLMQESAIKLSPGFITSVSVAYSTTKRQPPPYGICLDRPNYHQTDCIMKCEAQYVYEKCGCKFFYEKDLVAPICDFVELYKCAQTALFKFNNDLTMKGARSCNCPPQCVSNTYQLTVSQDIFSNRFATLASNFTAVNNVSLPVTLSKQVIMENYVAVQVYYSTMQYFSITTNPGYSFMGLLSDIGGALGLLLGATILTFVEIAEFVWELAWFWYITRFAKDDTKENKVIVVHKTKQTKIIPFFAD
ncbi:hypothetical protein HELRODRAFT_167244 [Helobdella robusta]|uniref:Uncharacterized protein n=1 Tax=Helobdella robusta TaxID=6412 RepID=T1EZ61_HELRO|nr:hypothetical protein HELRODRAFT_167244 [Helobdella robusta]ESO10748.1 hypothetical protein HELRODRAFT_167244 [Helobdella robusta]